MEEGFRKGYEFWQMGKERQGSQELRLLGEKKTVGEIGSTVCRVRGTPEHQGLRSE